MRLGKTLYVADRKSWRAWLAKHHRTDLEIWLVYYRVSSGKPRIDYNDAVEEALCYGWIDSTVKNIDSDRFAQRFSPRKPTSGLSQANIERIRKLIARRRMTRAGLAAVAHVFDPKKDTAARVAVPPAILKALKADPRAWKNFQAFPEPYKRVRLAFIESRRRHGREQFLRSLRHFVRMTSLNKRFGYVRKI